MKKKICLCSDDPTDWFGKVRELFEKKDCEFKAYPEISLEEADKIFYFNMPSEVKYPEKSYVWIAEPPVIFKRNFKKDKFKFFKKIFTWDKTLIDGKKFIKLNYPQNFQNIDFDLSKKEKLLCLVAKNKSSNRENELFSERAKAIIWFEKFAANDFDLYGKDWDLGISLNLGFIKYGKYFPKCYRGCVEKKDEVVRKHKFSIAYENWYNDRGYITEKIFDCFNASNVPIYLGEKNIEKVIPKNCFIDKRDFKNYKSLYEYIKNMDDSTYIEYLKNIDKYLKSDNAKEFTTEVWANTIVNEILSE